MTSAWFSMVQELPCEGYEPVAGQTDDILCEAW